MQDLSRQTLVKSCVVGSGCKLIPAETMLVLEGGIVQILLLVRTIVEILILLLLLSLLKE